MKKFTRTLSLEQLDLIEPLWIKLNKLHESKSTHFKSFFSENTFKKRTEKFKSMDPSNINVEVVEAEEGLIIGYCISTVIGNVGEIDSIFVEAHARKYGIGEQLVDNATKWLKDKNCSKIQVAVAVGHESVFDFYIRNGFYPRVTYLELK